LRASCKLIQCSTPPMWMQCEPAGVSPYFLRSMNPYSGISTRASCFIRRNAFDNPATTSPRPPVFANGVHSEATKRMFMDWGATLTGLAALRKPGYNFRRETRSAQAGLHAIHGDDLLGLEFSVDARARPRTTTTRAGSKRVVHHRA